MIGPVTPWTIQRTEPVSDAESVPVAVRFTPVAPVVTSRWMRSAAISFPVVVERCVATVSTTFPFHVTFGDPSSSRAVVAFRVNVAESSRIPTSSSTIAPSGTSTVLEEVALHVVAAAIAAVTNAGAFQDSSAAFERSTITAPPITAPEKSSVGFPSPLTQSRYHAPTFIDPVPFPEAVVPSANSVTSVHAWGLVTWAVTE